VDLDVTLVTARAISFTKKGLDVTISPLGKGKAVNIKKLPRYERIIAIEQETCRRFRRALDLGDIERGAHYGGRLTTISHAAFQAMVRPKDNAAEPRITAYRD
jgi:hypothetical protein